MRWWYNSVVALHRTGATFSVLLTGLLLAAGPVRADTRQRPVDVPGRSGGDVIPLRFLDSPPSRALRSSSLQAAGETLWVFRDSLESLSSPSNEGGWTHFDASAQPTAWHIDTLYSCTGHSFWCGRRDSSWTLDPDRMGYDNSWTQHLENFADLSGATGPFTLAFRQHIDVEPGFDFGTVEVFDPDDFWIRVATFTGKQPAAACDTTISVAIPDSIVAKYNPIRFRFTFTSDVSGSSADGLFTGDGWAIDSVTVKAGLTDIRFYDDFESGPGSWTVTLIPAAGDYWRLQSNVPAEQVCTTNASRVWDGVSAVTGSLVSGMDDQLVTPPVAVNRSADVFAAFDVYRNLPSLACYYYNVRVRTRNVGDLAWSPWQDPTSLLYFGNEREWLRQTIDLPGAGGKDSVQVRIGVKDYGPIFCGGSLNPGGTAILLDNFAIGVLGLAGPTISGSELDLFNDTFQTSVFYADDNFNTPRGDSLSVRIGASRGLKSAALWYSLNGGSFTSAALTRGPTAVPNAYFGDVPAGAYPRGTDLRYYFAATDSLDATTTLPIDALTASHYFTATILPAVQAPAPFCGGDSARVLYVNAAYGLNGPTPTDQSLSAVGLRYDRFDVNAPDQSAANTPGGASPGDATSRWPATSTATLGAYRTIVWDFGARSSGTLSASDQQLLQAWLGLRGSSRGLFLEGDNLAYDLTVNAQDIGTFLSCSLGASYLRDIWETSPQDSLTPVLYGATGTRMATSAFPFSTICPGLNRLDALSISACAAGKSRMWIRYPNNLAAAVERRDSLGVTGDSVRTVLLGASLGEAVGAAPRNLLLWHTLVEEFQTPYCYLPTGVEETAAGTPAARPVLYPAAPNPFNPETAIRFSLPRRAHARLLIFNVAGVRVRALAEGDYGPGPHLVRWDGRDDRGRDLSSGAYFYRLEADGASDARKLILLR